MVARSDVIDPTLSPDEYVEKVFSEDSSNAQAKHKSRVSADKAYTIKTVRKSYRKKHKSNLDYMSKTDPDSSYIARKGRKMFSYKYHFTVDKEQRVVTAVAVTPGAITEDKVLEELLDKQPVKVSEVCADSQYGTADNYALCWKRDIVPTFPRRSRHLNRNILSPDKFKYDENKDVVICPSGNELRRVTYDKRNRRWHYRARGSACRLCSLKSECSPQTKYRSIVRHVDYRYLEKSLNWLKTPGAEISIKERPCYAEWVIAEAKNLHGLSKTPYRGLEKVAIQCLMTAAVQNIRRLIAHSQRDGLESLLKLTKLLNLKLFSVCRT
jgi:hypothetical protein